ncbi:hypothetical protein [Amycolatopsis plumensis]|uniref:hypothetical protein n=1 Tax=Amycolatopsis plumensis TaxID=236508 RepID=UPI0036218C19
MSRLHDVRPLTGLGRRRTFMGNPGVRSVPSWRPTTTVPVRVHPRSGVERRGRRELARAGSAGRSATSWCLRRLGERSSLPRR